MNQQGPFSSQKQTKLKCFPFQYIIFHCKLELNHRSVTSHQNGLDQNGSCTLVNIILDHVKLDYTPLHNCWCPTINITLDQVRFWDYHQHTYTLLGIASVSFLQSHSFLRASRGFRILGQVARRFVIFLCGTVFCGATLSFPTLCLAPRNLQYKKGKNNILWPNWQKWLSSLSMQK